MKKKILFSIGISILLFTSHLWGLEKTLLVNIGTDPISYQTRVLYAFIDNNDSNEDRIEEAPEDSNETENDKVEQWNYENPHKADPKKRYYSLDIIPDYFHESDQYSKSKFNIRDITVHNSTLMLLKDEPHTTKLHPFKSCFITLNVKENNELPPNIWLIASTIGFELYKKIGEHASKSSIDCLFVKPPQKVTPNQYVWKTTSGDYTLQHRNLPLTYDDHPIGEILFSSETFSDENAKLLFKSPDQIKNSIMRPNMGRKIFSKLLPSKLEIAQYSKNLRQVIIDMPTSTENRYQEISLKYNKAITLVAFSSSESSIAIVQKNYIITLLVLDKTSQTYSITNEIKAEKGQIQSITFQSDHLFFANILLKKIQSDLLVFQMHSNIHTQKLQLNMKCQSMDVKLKSLLTGNINNFLFKIFENNIEVYTLKERDTYLLQSLILPDELSCSTAKLNFLGNLMAVGTETGSVLFYEYTLPTPTKTINSTDLRKRKGPCIINPLTQVSYNDHPVRRRKGPCIINPTTPCPSKDKPANLLGIGGQWVLLDTKIQLESHLSISAIEFISSDIIAIAAKDLNEETDHNGRHPLFIFQNITQKTPYPLTPSSNWECLCRVNSTAVITDLTRHRPVDDCSVLCASSFSGLTREYFLSLNSNPIDTSSRSFENFKGQSRANIMLSGNPPSIL